ncbi:MAG: DUF6089 family protein [Bacteroidota bacterium]|nr:DUF6089 family protein [Bacteroidota bacterium]
MRKITLVTLIGVLVPLFSFCQFWEFGVMLGASSYSGDLSPTPIVLKETHFAFGGLVRANVTDRFSLKANAYYGRLSGTDENAVTQKNKIRNLSFRSNVLDIGLNAEVNFVPFEAGNPNKRTAPYGFFGVSVFKFDPEALFNEQWVRLQPLGTEGQGTTRFNEREKYALTQIALPFGIGLKHNLGSNWNIGFEMGWRKTFTDYIDDVSMTYVNPDYLQSESGELSNYLSNRTGEVNGTRVLFDETEQRGNATNKDWYSFGGITITYTILQGSCFTF